MQRHILYLVELEDSIAGGFRICSLRRFDRNEIEQQRMKIIRFYEKYKEKVTNYLIFQRPHESLGLKSSLEYMIEKVGMSQMYVTYPKNRDRNSPRVPSPLMGEG